MPGFRAGPMPRIISPSGGSTLMTSPPSSPSICVATGPNTAAVTSMTRIPASGPDICFSWCQPPPLPLPRLRGRELCRARRSRETLPRERGREARRASGGRVGADHDILRTVRNSEDIRMIAPPDPDDLERVKAWFRRLSEHVQAVDFAGAQPLFADDMI